MEGKGGGLGGGEHEGILMRTGRWRSEHKFKVPLGCKGSPGCSAPRQPPCCLPSRRRAMSLPQSPIASSCWAGLLCRQDIHACACPRVRACALEEEGRGEVTGHHTTHVSERMALTEVPPREPLPWAQSPKPRTGCGRAAAGGACPRARCASCARGSGCCRASARRTAPFEHQTVPWRGSLVARYCRSHRDFGTS